MIRGRWRQLHQRSNYTIVISSSSSSSNCCSRSASSFSSIIVGIGCCDVETAVRVAKTNRRVALYNNYNSTCSSHHFYSRNYQRTIVVAPLLLKVVPLCVQRRRCYTVTTNNNSLLQHITTTTTTAIVAATTHASSRVCLQRLSTTSTASAAAAVVASVRRHRQKEIWLQSVYNDTDSSDDDTTTGVENVDHYNNLPSHDNHHQNQQQPQPDLSVVNWKDWYTAQEYENPWDMIYCTGGSSSSSSSLMTSRFLMHQQQQSSPPPPPPLFQDWTTTTTQSSSSSSSVGGAGGTVNATIGIVLKNLDYSTRQCISLLQNFHNFSMTTQNSITTEYANVQLHKLLQLLPTNTTTSSNSSSSHNPNSNNSSTSSSSSTTTGTPTITLTERSMLIAYRAYMIVQNMEYMDHTILMMPSPPSPPLNGGNNGGRDSHKQNTNDNQMTTTTTIRRRRRPGQGPHDNHTVNDTAGGDINNINNSISSSSAVGSSHRLPRSIPRPNRDTYNTILLLLSRTHSTTTTAIPQMAHEIVKQMEYRYNTLHELDMKVTNFHYNCILLSWSLCGVGGGGGGKNSNTGSHLESDKCIYATQLLLHSATRSNSHEIVDASSYIHVLRICANHVKLVVSDKSNSTTSNSHNNISSIDQSQLLLGANVAVQLWKEMFERGANDSSSNSNNNNPYTQQHHSYTENNNMGNSSTTGSSTNGRLLDYRKDSSMKAILTKQLTNEERDMPLYVPDLPPHFYSHFFQAIRPLPIIYSSQNHSRTQNNYSVRDVYYMKCMDHAIDNGKVNQYVLQEFFVHVKNKYIFDLYLGEYRNDMYGMTPNDAVQHLMTIVPKHWSNQIQTTNHHTQ